MRFAVQIYSSSIVVALVVAMLRADVPHRALRIQVVEFSSCLCTATPVSRPASHSTQIGVRDVVVCNLLTHGGRHGWQSQARKIRAQRQSPSLLLRCPLGTQGLQSFLGVKGASCNLDGLCSGRGDQAKVQCDSSHSYIRQR